MSMERFVPVRASWAFRKLVRTVRTSLVSGVNIKLILPLAIIKDFWKPILITRYTALTGGQRILVKR